MYNNTETLTNLVIPTLHKEDNGIESGPYALSLFPFGNSLEKDTTTSMINFTLSFEQAKRGLNAIHYSHKSEKLLLEAVRNFIRKMNFTELNESFEDGEISEDDFESKLNHEEEKYVVTLKDISSPEDATIIADLVNKIGFDLRDFSVSEVSEMFSVKEEQLIFNIKTFRNRIS